MGEQGIKKFMLDLWFLSQCVFLAFDFSRSDSFLFLGEFPVHYHGHTLLSLNSGVQLICKVEN